MNEWIEEKKTCKLQVANIWSSNRLRLRKWLEQMLFFVVVVVIVALLLLCSVRFSSFHRHSTLFVFILLNWMNCKDGDKWEDVVYCTVDDVGSIANAHCKVMCLNLFAMFPQMVRRCCLTQKQTEHSTSIHDQWRRLRRSRWKSYRVPHLETVHEVMIMLKLLNTIQIQLLLCSTSEFSRKLS